MVLLGAFVAAWKLSRICFFSTGYICLQQLKKAMQYKSWASGAYTSVSVLQACKAGDGFYFNS